MFHVTRNVSIARSAAIWKTLRKNAILASRAAPSIVEASGYSGTRTISANGWAAQKETTL